MDYYIAALEGLGATALSHDLSAIIAKVKACRTKLQCCFLKIVTTPYIYKNRERLIFDLFMSHHDLPWDWKCAVCRQVLDGTISTQHIVEIYSNFHDAKYQPINLSKEQLRKKALLRCEKGLLFMTINDHYFDDALKIYYTINTKNFICSLPRYAVRWHGILENKIRETVFEYIINPKGNTDPTSSCYYTLGALDLLNERYKVIPSKQVEEILNNALRASHGEIRKRGYRIGADIFGWSYYAKGLEDPSAKVREWIGKVLAAGEGYNFKRGRPRKKRDTNQLKLF